MTDPARDNDASGPTPPPRLRPSRRTTRTRRPRLDSTPLIARPREEPLDDTRIIVDPPQAQAQTQEAAKTDLVELLEDHNLSDTHLLERQLVGRIMGGCRVESLIGAGGMGAVFRAHHLALDRPVALKVLPQHLASADGMVDRFVLEARSVARIEHANIVQIYDIRAEEGLYYIVMQFVDGADTSAVMMNEGPLQVQRALDIIIQTCRALVAIHREGVIHRDLKPTNILLSRQGIAKITDLGLVKLLSQAQREDFVEIHRDATHLQTHMSTRIGTPAYMAPEQAEQGRVVDGRADIYALGATFFHLITGRPPFEAETADEILDRQRLGPVPNPRSINPWVPLRVCLVIARMMAKEPEGRYATAAALLKDLEALAETDLAQEDLGLRYSLSRPALKLNAFLVSTVLEEKIAGGEEIEDCLRLEAELVKFGTPRSLGEIFLERGIVGRDRLDEFVAAFRTSERMRHNSLFGRIAAGAGVLTRDTLREAMKLLRSLQREGEPPPALDEILVQYGFLTAQMVDAILRAQQSYMRRMDDSFFEQAALQAGVEKDAIAQASRSLASTGSDDPRSLVQVLVEQKLLTPQQAQDLVAEQVRRLVTVMSESGVVKKQESEVALHSVLETAEWSADVLRAVARALPGGMMPDAEEQTAPSDVEILPGPWSYLAPEGPQNSRVALQTLAGWVRNGQIGPESMVRGPTTGDRWTFASRTPGLSKYMGLCPHCQDAVAPDAEVCPSCDRYVDWPLHMLISDALAPFDGNDTGEMRSWDNRPAGCSPPEESSEEYEI
jgi:serine/threonine protein kinase